jgi:hypothetical protein
MNDPQPEGHMASYIARRKFLAALGGAAAWPLAAEAQQAAMSVIGFLNLASPEGYPPMAAAFHQGPQESGCRRPKRRDRIPLGGGMKAISCWRWRPIRFIVR